MKKAVHSFGQPFFMHLGTLYYVFIERLIHKVVIKNFLPYRYEQLSKPNRT